MINNKPNIFEFATKELSQDAVFCYILDQFHNPATKNIALKFLDRFVELDTDHIRQLAIKRQQDNIDIKVTVTYSDGSQKYVIIEDKVYSSLHNDQLQRYKNATVAREKCKAEDVVGIFFKLEEPLEWEKRACRAAGFRLRSYTHFLEYIEEVKGEDPILHSFFDFFQNRVAYMRMVDTCDFDALQDCQFEELIGSRYGQRKLTQWMMEKIFAEDYRKEKIYDVNNYGSPCTQYEFIFDKETKAEEWGLPECDFPQREDYGCFFRVDRNAKGWYISIRQYFRKGANEEESEASNRKRCQLLNILNADGDDAPNRKAKKEKNLLLYNIDSMSRIHAVLPKLKKATEYLLNEI